MCVNSTLERLLQRHRRPPDPDTLAILHRLVARRAITQWDAEAILASHSEFIVEASHEI